MSLELVGSMMDLSASMMTLGARQLGAVLGEAASRQAVAAALRLMQESAEAVHAALPGEAGLEWRELANKLEAFESFQQAPALVGLAPGAEPSLEAQLRRAAALGTYRSVWTIEGLGYALAESAWAVGRAPRRLFADARLNHLPAHAVVPLHTGAGLSFAGRLLAMDGALSSADLARWIAQWEENARPGYRCIAVEALGLVARNLHPHLLPGLGGLLGAIDPVLAEHLWHGAGRGLYFVPSHAVPYSGAAGRALEKARREPPDEPGGRNAIAGLAWALTLVNLRQPAILAGVLRRHLGEIGSTEAFANGVASAVLVWYDIVGLDSHLDAFLAYRPEGPAQAALWRDLVARPCEEALQHTYPRLRQSGGMAPLFRCPPGKGVSGP
jgi:hypothetical protein